jgi:hypothetical protein
MAMLRESFCTGPRTSLKLHISHIRPSRSRTSTMDNRTKVIVALSVLGACVGAYQAVLAVALGLENKPEPALKKRKRHSNPQGLYMYNLMPDVEPPEFELGELLMITTDYLGRSVYGAFVRFGGSRSLVVSRSLVSLSLGGSLVFSSLRSFVRRRVCGGGKSSGVPSLYVVGGVRRGSSWVCEWGKSE